MTSNKKAQANSVGILISIAIAILVLGVIVASGGKIIDQIKDQELTTADSIITNESVVLINGTTTSLAYQRVKAGAYNLYNDTAHAIVIKEHPANYTMNKSNGIISFSANATAQWGNNKTKYLNYTYTVDVQNEVYNITNSGGQGLIDLAEWTPTIVVVVVAMILIGLVVMLLGRRLNE